MALYTAALSCGVSGGIVVSGLITIHLNWRYIYWVATALTGALTIVVAATMPETAFNRSPVMVTTDRANASRPYTTAGRASDAQDTTRHRGFDESKSVNVTKEAEIISSPAKFEAAPRAHRKETYWQSLRLYHGQFTSEPLWRLALRPIPLLIMPPILWATLVLSVSIGFLVAISTTFAPAFATVYQFQPYQSGLCFISGLVGTLASIFFAGKVSDQVADFFTRRNNGIREPEMRLPAAMIGLVTAPLGLVLYGVGINNHLHWMVPTLGLALCKSY